MIKVIDAKERPETDIDGEPTGSTLVVIIEVDGMRLSVGGLDTILDRSQLHAHLDSIHPKLRSHALKSTAVMREPIDRPDLHFCRITVWSSV